MFSTRGWFLTLSAWALLVSGCHRQCDSPPPASPSGPTSSSSEEDCCTEAPSRGDILAKSQSADAPSPIAQREGERVELKVVKLDQLKQAVAAQKGKIVVIDVWGEFCVPCKKEFPQLVELHHKHGKDGLVCMSLTVDEVKDKEAALKFLQAKKAVFANYLIDEDAGVWQDHFDLKGVPAVFVYDRTGKLAHRFTNDDPDNQFTYTDVEKTLAKLLQSK